MSLINEMMKDRKNYYNESGDQESFEKKERVSAIFTEKKNFFLDMKFQYAFILITFSALIIIVWNFQNKLQENKKVTAKDNVIRYDYPLQASSKELDIKRIEEETLKPISIADSKGFEDKINIESTYPSSLKLASLGMSQNEEVVDSTESTKNRGIINITHTSQSQPKTIKNILSKVTALQKIGGYEEALSILLSGIQKYPNSKELRAQLISFYLDTDQIDDAEKAISMSLKLDSQYMPFLRLKARSLAYKKQYQDAIQILLDTAPSLQEEPEHYSLIASFYQQKEEHEKAAKLYIELLSSFPEHGRWWTGLGISLEHLNEQKDALESYLQAVNTKNIDQKLRMFANQRIRELSKTEDVSSMNGYREMRTKG